MEAKFSFLVLASMMILPNGPSEAAREHKMMIEIVPLGEVENQVLEYLMENLPAVFGAQLSQAEARAIPEKAFNSSRNQYHASIILQSLSGVKRPPGTLTLTVIDKDLYVPELNFVFGQADRLHNICLISITRLRQSYYGLPEDENIFLPRTLKEAVHELGHLLNLGHCPNPRCVMHFSNSLSDTDRKDYRFCGLCQKRLS
jgi:archaemetzincin